MKRRRRRKVFWTDTRQSYQWTHIVGDAINDQAVGSTPGWHAIQMFQTRQPAIVESVSSVLAAKDEGFRLRRVVGDLVLKAGQIEDDQTNRYLWSVAVGLIVGPMDDNGAPNDLSQMFQPGFDQSMSDPWLYRRVFSWEYLSTATLTDETTFASPTNQVFDPVGSWIDIRVNRRVGPEENLWWIFQWAVVGIPNVTLDLSARSYLSPAFKLNVRTLISR